MAPRLLLDEVASALLTGVRRRRWTGAAADESHSLLLRMPLRLVDDERDLVRAWNLARRYDNHPLYDMLYVALAERVNTAFITADEALRKRLRQLPWILAPEQASG
jgi:predicted nucleic acid-binding protein